MAGKFSKNQKSSFLSLYSNKLIRPRQSFFVISKNVEKRPEHWLFWNLTKKFSKKCQKSQNFLFHKIHFITPFRHPNSVHSFASPQFTSIYCTKQSQRVVFSKKRDFSHFCPPFPPGSQHITFFREKEKESYP